MRRPLLFLERRLAIPNCGEKMNRTVDPLLVAETASGNEDVVRYSGTQKELAEKAQEIILQNIYQHMTIREISFLLHVSPTQLKTCFRKVYGTPVYSFAKTRRMKEASRLLLETNAPVLEIAGRFGYENGSKFAHAFRSVIGVTPTEYRKRNRTAV